MAETSGQQEVLGFQITKEFLEFSFEKQVESFKSETGTNPGDNYLSIMFAVEILFKGESTPKHFLIKCYPNHPGRREFLDQLNVFEKELFIYNDFLPQLEKMANDSGTDLKTIGLATAPFHGGNVTVSPSEKFKGTEWGKENFLIMTDLRRSGYTMADRITGLDVEHAKFVLENQARLHALCWAYKEKNGLNLLSDRFPSFLDKMYAGEDPSIDDQFSTLMDQILSGALNAVESSIGTDHPAYKRFKETLDLGYMEIMKKFMRPQGLAESVFENMLRIKPADDNNYNTELWLTGTHGDCWVNNMLFHYDSNSKPDHLILVDFQIFREACPTVDMAYFFFSSVRARLRKVHKDELLQTYHDAFVKSCKELKVNPYPGFSVESLKRRFRRAEFFGLLVSLPILSVVLKPKGESKDLDKEEGKDAVEIFSSVVGGADKNTKFKDELTTVVLDLYENGVL